MNIIRISQISINIVELYSGHILLNKMLNCTVKAVLGGKMFENT